MDAILVTGGAGFIGSCLVRMLVGQGRFQVVNLDKLTYAGNLDSLASIVDNPLHQFVQGDIGNESVVSELLRKYQPRAIIHLAAETHVDRSIDMPAPFVETNVVGTFRLLETACRYWSALGEPARSQFRFVHVSTDEVYGSLGPDGFFTETSPYAPNSPYAASKAAGDHFARSFHRTYGLPVVTTNSSNNYGPFQFPEKLVPLVILNALEGKPLPVYDDGGNVRDWLFVEDNCRALLAALERGAPGEVYNIGAQCEQTNLALVTKLCQIIDDRCPELQHTPCDSLIQFVPDRPGHDRRYAIDAAKARRELGWQPQQHLDAGLRATVDWYLHHSAWVERVASGGYHRERLGIAGQLVTAATQHNRR
jgi:dTDP-glucose 4,6-dehydratase